MLRVQCSQCRDYKNTIMNIIDRMNGMYISNITSDGFGLSDAVACA